MDLQKTTKLLATLRGGAGSRSFGGGGKQLNRLASGPVGSSTARKSLKDTPANDYNKRTKNKDGMQFAGDTSNSLKLKLKRRKSLDLPGAGDHSGADTDSPRKKHSLAQSGTTGDPRTDGHSDTLSNLSRASGTSKRGLGGRRKKARVVQ